jgi:hypothetical protein
VNILSPFERSYPFRSPGHLIPGLHYNTRPLFPFSLFSDLSKRGQASVPLTSPVCLAPKLMSISQDIPIYGDINTWNQHTQSSVIDPNTLPVTPPHTLLQRSTTDNMSLWDDNANPNEQTWDSPSNPQNTTEEPAIASDFQAQDFSAGMNIEAGIDCETPARPPRRPREYGMFLHLTLLHHLSPSSFRLWSFLDLFGVI